MNRSPMPNVFILGPPKTATTSLAFWMNQHHDVIVSNPKETLFFEFEYYKGPDYYASEYFRHYNNQKIICDARPMNIVVKYVAERIFETCDNPKFIIVLRDPFERMYSDWYNWSSMRPGRAHKIFSDGIDYNLSNFNLNKFELEGDYVPFCDKKGGSYIPTYIESSLYWNMISNYLDFFDKDDFIFLNFDDLISDTVSQMSSLFSKLSISDFKIYDKTERNMSIKKHETKNGGDVVSIMNKDTFLKINGIFKDDVLKLMGHFKHDESVLKYCDNFIGRNYENRY